MFVQIATPVQRTHIWLFFTLYFNDAWGSLEFAHNLYKAESSNLVNMHHKIKTKDPYSHVKLDYVLNNCSPSDGCLFIQEHYAQLPFLVQVSWPTTTNVHAVAACRNYPLLLNIEETAGITFSLVLISCHACMHAEIILFRCIQKLPSDEEK